MRHPDVWVFTDDIYNKLAYDGFRPATILEVEPRLRDRTVTVKYVPDLNRRLTLVDIRLTGTDKLPIEEIKPVLKSQEASLIGIIPYLGYGRGYTSAELLDEDRTTIQTLMRELGYRRHGDGWAAPAGAQGIELARRARVESAA